MKKVLRKPYAVRIKVLAYDFEECSVSGTFNPCGLKW